MKVRVSIDVMLKDGILDPQGKTVEQSLPSLGYDGVEGVRIGKHIEMVVEGDSIESVRAEVEEMTQRFLSNPVIEDAVVTIEGDLGE
ncbi:MAG: phosphoribosylformylglycinamidine synthase subunit PurS [Actinomycetota bacterium]|nr:phosphoribosylformylglycinamidine synthase subunit PurS [Actinomycetota bacterium]